MENVIQAFLQALKWSWMWNFFFRSTSYRLFGFRLRMKENYYHKNYLSFLNNQATENNKTKEHFLISGFRRRLRLGHLHRTHCDDKSSHPESDFLLKWPSQLMLYHPSREFIVLTYYSIPTTFFFCV